MSTSSLALPFTSGEQAKIGSRVGRLLIWLFLIGLYTQVPIVVGGLAFQAVFAFLAGTVLLLRNAPRIRAGHLLLIAGYIGVGALTVLLAPEATLYFGERVKSLILMVMTFSAAYGFYLEAVKLDRAAWRRIFRIFLIIIIVGSALEITVPYFKFFSDMFRYAVFSVEGYGEIVYDSDARDIAQFGMVRPKLFNSEPSYLAMFFSLSAMCWLALSESRRRYLIFFAVLAAGMLLIRSPNVALAGLGAVAVRALPRPYAPAPKAGVAPRAGGRARLPFVALLGTGIAIAGVLALLAVMPNRVASMAEGRDASFGGRILGPVLVTIEANAHSPLVGAGLGGDPYLGRLAYEVYQRAGFSIRGADNKEGLERSIGHNLFYLYWAYYGLVGGVIGLFFIARLIRALGGAQYLFMTITLTAMYHMTGGMAAQRTIAYFFLLLLAARLATPRATVSPGQTSDQTSEMRS